MGPGDHKPIAADVLSAWVRDARRRTLELTADLDDSQLLGPRLSIVNPLLWEIGHVAWFQERWVLRHANGRPPLRPDADALYDSAAVAHDTRWDLTLPSREETLRYMARVEEQVLERLAGGPDPDDVYFTQLAVFHEDMHAEAFTYTRQTLGYPKPRLSIVGDSLRESQPADAPWGGDVPVAGGDFLLGAAQGGPFVFDNEKWAHPVTLRPFAIARSPVTQAEFAVFVEDAGYRRRELWSGDGWAWREKAAAESPLYWRREACRWLRRDFDRWVALEPRRPMIHVNWYEAEAYCRWAGRRLPAEAEWEMAASKRRFPWGDEPPTPERANLDGRALGCVGAAAHAAGDSPCGCRQMIGNVWEWTADAFLPYPGFTPDPYKEYSAPWFGDHRVLRGGCWATRGRLLRNTWRNFYRPARRDVFAGFPDLRLAMKICLVTPAPPGSRKGNRITALRWARILRGLGRRVTVRQEYRGEPCDLLVALHALRSFPSVERYRSARPDGPLVLALTGTDLYGSIHTHAEARKSLDMATRLIVLQPLGAAELPPAIRDKTRVIFQSVPTPRVKRAPRTDAFEVCVLGHLRPVKDPFRTALAARLLPASSRVRILHVGGALSEDMAEQARQEEAVNPRYRWMEELPRWKSLRVLARCRLLSLTSEMEGGANAISEALAASVPVLSSRIAGSVGLLGAGYPGCFPVGDAAALAGLLTRAETDVDYYRTLRDWCVGLRPLVEPERERRSWEELLGELGR